MRAGDFRLLALFIYNKVLSAIHTSNYIPNVKYNEY